METSEKKAIVLKALEQSYGNVSAALDLTIGENGKPIVSRTIHYEWVNNDPEYKAAVESISDRRLDIVEDAAFKLAKGVTIQKTRADGSTEIYEEPPNPNIVAFLLKTKGRKRGYGDKTEIELSGNTQTRITLELGHSRDNNIESLTASSEQANLPEAKV